MIRGFLAVSAGPVLCEALGVLQATLADADSEGRVRWVRPETWHLTLRFLGSVEDELVAPLMALLGEAIAGVRAFEVPLSEIQFFPTAKRPRVVSVGLAPSGELANLAERVGDACSRAGFPREDRRFRAHLTLGRIRQGAPALPECGRAALPPLTVREVVLLRSHLGKGGSRYETLAARALAPALGESA